MRVMVDGTDCQSVAWAVELREISSGVVTARTLLGNSRANVVARVLNYSDTPYVFQTDSYFGSAEPLEAAEERELFSTSVPAEVAGIRP